MLLESNGGECPIPESCESVPLLQAMFREDPISPKLLLPLLLSWWFRPPLLAPLESEFDWLEDKKVGQGDAATILEASKTVGIAVQNTANVIQIAAGGAKRRVEATGGWK